MKNDQTTIWRTWAALLCSLAVCSRAPAHVPHDVMTEVAAVETDGGVRVAAQYHFPTRPLILVSDDSGRSWQFTAPAELSEVLRSLHFVSPDELVAADGVSPEVLISEDGGRTWALGLAPDGTPVHWVAPTTSGVQFAGTDQGLATRAQSGGEWQTVTWDGAGPVTRVATAPGFPGDPFVAAIGDGDLWCSDDGGGSWRGCAPPGAAGVARVLALSPEFGSDDSLWIGTEDGRIAGSEDRGWTWTEGAVSGVGIEFDDEVRDLLVTSSGRLIAVSPDFAAACSEDGGTSWRGCGEGIPPITPGQSASWGHYRRLSATAGGASPLLLASFEGLYGSDEGGTNWSEWCTLLPDYVRAVAVSPGYPDDPRAWIGSYGAGLLVTRDGGSSWSVTDLPHSYVEEAYPAPQFPDDPVFFLVADRDLLRSEDGALSFERIDIPTLRYLHKLHLPSSFAEDGQMYAVGNVETANRWALARSDDAGLTWQIVWDPGEPESQIPQIALSPHYTDDRTLFGIQSRPSAVMRSTDRGESWDMLLEIPDSTRLTGLFPLDEEGNTTLLVVTGEGGVWRSRGGDVWEELESLPGCATQGVVLGEPANPVAAVILEPPGLARTRDHGDSWEIVELPFGSIPLSIVSVPGYPNEPTLMLSTHYGTFFSCDDGQSWSLLDRLLRLEEEACPLRYEGAGWEHVAGFGGADGSMVSYSAADAVEVEFWGRTVRWMAVAGLAGGSTEVFVDGSSRGVVDTATAAADGVAYEENFDTDGFHTLRLVALGDGPVAVDAIEVERHRVMNGPDEVHDVGPWCVDLPELDAESPGSSAEGGGCESNCGMAERGWGGGVAGIGGLIGAVAWIVRRRTARR